MAIADQETFAAVRAALDNCGYVTPNSMIAAVAAVIQKGREMGMNDQEIARDWHIALDSIPGDEERLFGQ